ncbi:MAG: thioredoxin domain-containing protein, partial [Myxococcales bacterium]|nr:thioredoxin domain-containing protein [Myxococcales bacterium]
MNPTICRAGLALLLGVGGCQGQAQRADSHATASAAPIAPATRYRVDLLPDDQALGGEAPLVTVVLYSDYACPPCARTWAVLENLVEDYGDDLRVVVRSLTAPGFKAGEEAVEAALAAGAQGAFWPMHRRLFTAPPRERREIEAHAAALNLDLDRLREDLDTGAFTGPRLRQRRQALELGVAFGPVAFVNGRPVVGFHEEGEWHALIDAELAEARRRVAAGTPREGLYEAILEGSERAPIALEGEAAAARDALLAKIPPSIDDLELGPEPDEGRRYQVPLGGAVYYGPADAPVVIVAFMDAACPYCRRALSTALADLETRYPLELRLEIRHLPLPIHPSAEGAARAA